MVSTVVAPPAVRALPERGVGLFPAAPCRPVRPRDVVLAVLAVAAGTGVSLARTTGTGPFQSIWEEDARDLLTGALTNPGAFNIVKPFVGYFQVGPRLLAEFAAFFPVSWAAAVLSTEAAVVTALLTLVVYVSSGTHLRHPLARGLVAAPMLFSPVAENVFAEVYNRPAALQFFVVYAVFWLMLWVPAGRPGRGVLVGVVGLSAFSTFLVVLFLPLAAVRVYARRDRTSVALLGMLTAGAALQMSGLVLGLTNRSFTTPRYEPAWALGSFVTWALPQSLLGYRWAHHTGDVAHTGNWLLVVLPWLPTAGAVGPSWPTA